MTRLGILLIGTAWLAGNTWATEPVLSADTNRIVVLARQGMADAREDVDAETLGHSLPVSNGQPQTAFHKVIGEFLKVNGTALKTRTIIQITGNAKFTPAAYYVVRGYQTAEFGSGNTDPEDPSATAPQTEYQLRFRFMATTVLRSGEEDNKSSE